MKWTLCWLTRHEFDTRVSVWVVFPVLFNSLNRFSFFLLQITFAKTNTSFTVNDDCVKGSLKVNFLFIVWASMNVIPLDNLLPRFPSCCFDTLVFEHFKIIFWGYFLVFSKVGAVVEAKTPDGVMEGVITKLTDASVYTVGKHQWFFLSVV